MGDVQVMQGAAGVPWGLNGLDDMFGTVRDSNFLWASRCLPALKKNSVYYYSGGEISITKGKELWISDGTGSCFTSSADLSSVILPTDDFSMIKGACTGNHTLGTATILFAATNWNSNVTRYGVVNGYFSGYADYLAAAVGHGVLLDKVDNTGSLAQTVKSISSKPWTFDYSITLGQTALAKSNTAVAILKPL